MNLKTSILVMVAIVCGIVSSVAVKTAKQTKGLCADGRMQPSAFDLPSQSVQKMLRRNADLSWPPSVGDHFPDVVLRDTAGAPIQLSKYRGKVILLEPIGVACNACQAFSGGHEIGGLFSHRPQPGLRSLHEYVEHYGQGVRLNGENIVLIHVLFYGDDGQNAPTLEEAQKWADHFGKHRPSTVFLYADQSFTNSQTRAMIPGCLLIDRDFVLRSMAGNPPKADLYRELIPMIKEVL